MKCVLSVCASLIPLQNIYYIIGLGIGIIHVFCISSRVPLQADFRQYFHQFHSSVICLILLIHIIGNPKTIYAEHIHTSLFSLVYGSDKTRG